MKSLVTTPAISEKPNSKDAVQEDGPTITSSKDAIPRPKSYSEYPLLPEPSKRTLKRSTEEVIDPEHSPRKRSRLIEEATEDALLDTAGDAVEEGTSPRRPPGPIGKGTQKQQPPRKRACPVEETLDKEPSPRKRARLMEGATTKETRPKKRPGRKKHQMIDILSGTTSDPLPLPTIDSATESPNNGLDIISPTRSRDSRAHGYLETELRPARDDDRHPEATTGASSILAEQSSHADTFTSLSTSLPSSAEDEPFHYTRNEAAQPASPENKKDQPECAPHKRVAQLKAGTKKADKRRPRRSAYGLRSGRKEIPNDG